jgi:hypothetical protein
MARNRVRMSDHLELPAPAAVGMILITAVLAKGGHLYWAMGGMIAFYGLFALARLGLTRFNEQRAIVASAPAARLPDLSLVPSEPVKSLSPVSPIPPRDPRPSTAPRAPWREAA